MCIRDRNISASKLHHAYILIGPLGAGLERFANVFASSLICKNLTDSMQACGKCQDCQWLSTEHQNLRVIDNESEEGASKNISIESIRSIKKFVELSSHSIGGKKVILINNAESLTINAANALLKILEEPPDNSYLILTAQNISSLLPTIISRCLMFKAPAPSTDDARSFLKAEGYENLSSQLPLFSNLPLDVIAHQSDSDIFTIMINEFKKGGSFELMAIEPRSVSYTHLTLPTKA